MALHESKLVGADIGCPKCARGVRAGVLVLAQCRSCHALGIDIEERMLEVGWGELPSYLNQYCIKHNLPFMHAVYKGLHHVRNETEARVHLFCPLWLSEVLKHGTTQKNGPKEYRLNWPKVLQRCRYDEAFRETLLATIAVCSESATIHAGVLSLDPSMGDVPIPDKVQKRNGTRRRTRRTGIGSPPGDVST